LLAEEYHSNYYSDLSKAAFVITG